MRAYVLLSFAIALAYAFPGSWGTAADHGNDKDPKAYGHGYEQPVTFRYSPITSAESKYEEPRPGYTKHEAVIETSCTTLESLYTKHDIPYSKSGPVYTKHEVVIETTCTTPETLYTTHDIPPSKPTPLYIEPTIPLVCPTTCRLDFHGTFLGYPTYIEWSAVYAETINAFVTSFDDGSPAQTREETITALPGPAASSSMTWEAFGAQLTYPTTYVVYTSIQYATVEALLPENTCGSTEAPLQFPTIWPSLMAESRLIQQPRNIPPATIIAWIDSLPGVQEQLGGHVCDPANGGLAPFVPTVTVTSATTIAGNTRIVQSTFVSVTPVTSIAPPAPPAPPSTTSVLPPPPPPPLTTQGLPLSSQSTARPVVVQTVNAAILARKPSLDTWIGNVLTALLLAF